MIGAVFAGVDAPPSFVEEGLRESVWAGICADKTSRIDKAHTNRAEKDRREMMGSLICVICGYTSRAQRKPEIIQRSCA